MNLPQHLGWLIIIIGSWPWAAMKIKEIIFDWMGTANGWLCSKKKMQFQLTDAYHHQNDHSAQSTSACKHLGRVLFFGPSPQTCSAYSSIGWGSNWTVRLTDHSGAFLKLGMAAKINRVTCGLIEQLHSSSTDCLIYGKKQSKSTPVEAIRQNGFIVRSVTFFAVGDI